MAMIKWTVEIQVDSTWVADGFNLNKDILHDMVSRSLPYAYSQEIKTRVIAKPHDAQIANLQGFPSVYAMKRANGK